jgi:sortase B
MRNFRKHAPRAAVAFADGVVNLVLFVIEFAMLAYGVYSIWDTGQVVSAASPVQYAEYKPNAEEELSFEKLRDINSEVFAWLTIYGTNIDYPVVQGEDNEKYVRTDAKGDYSMTGAVFMDRSNDRSFRHFNSIIYAHHMTGGAMFGDLSEFVDEQYFEEHRYGNLYFDGRNHGVELFAFLEANAYDEQLYSPGIIDEEKKAAYLDKIAAEKLYGRDVDVTTDDRLVLLSTCTEDITNGRYVLIGRITDQTYEDTFPRATLVSKTYAAVTGTQVDIKVIIGLLLLFLALILLLLFLSFQKVQRRNRELNVNVKEIRSR